MSESKPGFGRTKRLILVSCLILLMIVAAVIGVIAYMQHMLAPIQNEQTGMSLAEYPYILPNTSIHGIDISGLTVEDAESRILTALAAEDAEQCFLIRFPDNTLELRDYVRSEIPTLKQALNEAYAHGRSISASLEEAMAAAEAAPLSLNPKCAVKTDEATIRKTISTYAKTLDARATDCKIIQNEQELSITKGRDGRAIDEDLLYRDVMIALKTGKTELEAKYTTTTSGVRQLTQLHERIVKEPRDAMWDPQTQDIAPEETGLTFDLDAALKRLTMADDGATIHIPLEVTEPKITAELLAERLFVDKLSAYDSPHTAIYARTNNLILACKAIDGLILNPGDVFSYNETVGERTAEKGYMEAAVYIGGETQDSLGGGVCQVASTIYYCALMANLEIVERTEHMYYVTYVPSGLDATVYWGVLDFRFRNNTDYPLRIDASVSGGYVHIALYGTNVDGSYVEMRSETLSTTPWTDVVKVDETKPVGFSEVTTTPYTGYVVKTYRDVYSADGELISSALEASSTYHKRDRVTTVGPEEEPAPPEEPELPENPEPSEEPELPENPETPDAPDMPEHPDTPDTPDIPSDEHPDPPSEEPDAPTTPSDELWP